MNSMQKKSVRQSSESELKKRGKNQLHHENDFWTELAVYFDKAENRLDKMMQKAERKADKSVGKVDKFWSESQKWLNKKIDHLTEGEENIEEAYDFARLKAHLASMEFKDFVSDLEERLGRINDKFHNMLKKSERESLDIVHKIGDSCTNLATKKSAEWDDACDYNLER